jgi:hypothetical protein
MVRSPRVARERSMSTVVADYWKTQFPDAPLITAYWGGRGSELGDADYFPPYSRRTRPLQLVNGRAPRLSGLPVAVGYHWTLTYRSRGRRLSLDDRRRFPTHGPTMPSHARRMLYLRTRLAGGGAPLHVPGIRGRSVVERGRVRAARPPRCELIQVDQVVGGNFPFALREIRSARRGRGTDVFAEARTMSRPAGRSNPIRSCVSRSRTSGSPSVGIQDYRDCERPRMGVGVLHYLITNSCRPFQSNRAGTTPRWRLLPGQRQIPHMGRRSAPAAGPCSTGVR